MTALRLYTSPLAIYKINWAQSLTGIWGVEVVKALYGYKYVYISYVYVWMQTTYEKTLYGDGNSKLYIYERMEENSIDDKINIEIENSLIIIIRRLFFWAMLCVAICKSFCETFEHILLTMRVCKETFFTNSKLKFNLCLFQILQCA